MIAAGTFRSNLYAVLATHCYLPFNLSHFMTQAIPLIITVWRAVSFYYKVEKASKICSAFQNMNSGK